MTLSRRTFVAGALAASSVGVLPSRALSETTPASRQHGFGWVRDRPNPRDAKFGAPGFVNQPARPKVKDLSAQFPPAFDQGELNSCTANAASAAIQYARRVHNKPDDFVPSRLFIYYQARIMEDCIYTDGGSQIGDAIAAVTSLGVCAESDWPYDSPPGDAKTHVFPNGARAIQAPPANILAKANAYKTISTGHLAQSESDLEGCIAGGYPFLFGFTVFTNFSDTTRLLKAPGPGDRITPEGHAVLCVGYDNTKRLFRIRNSWGPAKNDKGYFDMDYDYVLNSRLSSDFWVVYQTLGFASARTVPYGF
jgi:C1A family cysteine protease